mmetsp:Transcript_3400/g.10055  ORF Transcript_3400/g.10055 Transcript_3400/m.10055 type:complete len:209 (+) Transcript_3400:27-653(+)
MTSRRTSESRWPTKRRSRAETSASPRTLSSLRACTAAPRTPLSASSSAATEALSAAGSPRSATRCRTSRAAHRISGSGDWMLPGETMSASTVTAWGSPRCQRRRRAANAALATGSERSCSAPVATPMPWAPPKASACATSSRAAARTSGSGFVVTSRARSTRNSGHSPRGGQMDFSVLRPVLRTEQSASASATVAVRTLFLSPGTASA